MRRSSLNYKLLLCAVLVFGLMASAALESPRVQASKLPTQAATQVEWNAGRPIRLRYGDIKLRAGIDPVLLAAAEKAKDEKQPAIRVIAQRGDVPQPEAWADWSARGIRYGSYLGEGSWILHVDLTSKETADERLNDLMRDFQAQILTMLRPEQKAHPLLLVDNSQTDRFIRQVEVTINAFEDTPSEVIEALLLNNSAVNLREVAPGAWTAKCRKP